MKPARITLIRHGESIGNVDRSVHATIPDYRLDLTPRGRQQAEDAGRRFAATLAPGERVAIYRSPFFRTRQTLECFLIGLGEDRVHFIREDLRLREQEYGHLRNVEEAQRIDQERDAYGALYFRVPDGESGADVFDRCSGFLDTLHRDFEKPDFPSRVLLVTHGMTLRVMLMRWLHLTPEEFQQMRNPHNCEMFDLVRGEDGRYRLSAPFPQKQPR